MDKKCGIYQIRNLVNGKLYIGQSVDLHKRELEHFNKMKNNKHVNSHLQNAYNKYGKENFIFEIIEECEGLSKVELTGREQFYSDIYDVMELLYNIRRQCVDSNLGFKHSEKSKRLISKNANPGNKGGWHHTEKTKEMMSISRSGKNHWRIFDEAVILDIINLLGTGIKLDIIAENTGVSVSTIDNIRSGFYHNIYDLPEIDYVPYDRKGVNCRNITPEDVVLKIIDFLNIGKFSYREIAEKISVSENIIQRVMDGFYHNVYELPDINYIPYDRKGLNTHNILPKDKVLRVRKMLKTNIRLSDIAKEIGIGIPVVRKIRDGWYDEMYNLENQIYAPYNRSGINSPDIMNEKTILKVIKLLNSEENMTLLEIKVKAGVSADVILQVRKGFYHNIYDLPEVKYTPYDRKGKNSSMVMGEDVVIKIKEKLKESMSMNRIARILHVGVPTIVKVRDGYYDEIYGWAKEEYIPYVSGGKNIIPKKLVLEIKDMLESNISVKEIVEVGLASRSMIYKVKDGFYDNKYNLNNKEGENNGIKEATGERGN